MATQPVPSDRGTEHLDDKACVEGHSARVKALPFLSTLSDRLEIKCFGGGCPSWPLLKRWTMTRIRRSTSKPILEARKNIRSAEKQLAKGQTRKQLVAKAPPGSLPARRQQRPADVYPTSFISRSVSRSIDHRLVRSGCTLRFRFGQFSGLEGHNLDLVGVGVEPLTRDARLTSL